MAYCLDFSQNSLIFAASKQSIHSMSVRVSGSTLKVIAVVTMLIDHAAGHILVGMDWMYEPWMELGHHVLNPYTLMRGIGRMAFPIFGFLIVEGYRHTRDRRRYGRNLLLFALLSEVPWDLLHRDSFFYRGQNVFFTLALGFMAICLYERHKDDVRKLASWMAGLVVVTLVCHADYGLPGVGFILTMHLLRDNRVLLPLLGTCMMHTLPAALAFIPIGIYDGSRGFVRGSFWKYAFYLIYPVHLLVFYFVKVHLYGHP